MRKIFTLAFLMGIFGLFTTNLFAQQDATIDPADIQYWIGEGENEVVVALSWCSHTETALAWGYRFDGEATVFQALTDIAAADSRLTVIGSAPTNITYVDDEYDLTMCPNPDAQWGDPDYDVPMHSVNGLMGQNMMAEEPIHNGRTDSQRRLCEDWWCCLQHHVRRLDHHLLDYRDYSCH